MKRLRLSISNLLAISLLAIVSCLFALELHAQSDAAARKTSLSNFPATPDDGAPAGQQKDDYVISVETELVVLHVTVTDKNGKPVADLKQNEFRVFEDKVEQQLKVFKREDIPVAVGILVDNSGSMRDKRKGVNAAAMKFVKSSNPADEVFIVNFNEEAFLDADFTGNPVLLEDALEKIDARGGTAYYDAIDMSLDHLKEKATLDKRVLIAITDGEDNASKTTLEQLVQKVGRSNVMIYTAALLGSEDKRAARRAKRALQAISKASGGSAFFPRNPAEVDEMASIIADDIRNQYVLAYTPTNTAKDGTFRRVEVRINAPKRGKLIVRTRSGYYAAGGSSATPASATGK
jgi:Ca-activated chloride channel family protein